MKRQGLSFLLALVLLLTACPPLSLPAQAAANDVGSGEIVYAEGAGKLTKAMEKLLLSFLNGYYGSLVDLKAQDPSALFAADTADQIKLNRAAWDLEVKLRAMQKQDLALTGYSFTLEIRSVDKQEDGSYRIRAREDWVQNFKAYPGVNSKGFDVSHLFVLTKEGKNWRIREHRQNDSLFDRLYGDGDWDLDKFPGSPRVNANKKAILEEAQKAVAGRAKQGKKKKNISYDNDYDRKAATAYARKYVGRRNSNWFAYDRYGGNCQNFVSQALLAGGIPLDTVSPGLWKWYSSTPNNRFNKKGRSLSWASVSNFFTYAKTNRGYGLVAHVDAPYYTGEPGDIIQMGTADKWRHTVMITRVMKDSSGETADYLIASNTADLRDFPASAYHYSTQMLIKICGWNDEPKEEEPE